MPATEVLSSATNSMVSGTTNGEMALNTKGVGRKTSERIRYMFLPEVIHHIWRRLQWETFSFRMTSYIASISQDLVLHFDSCSSTNMQALSGV